MSNVARSDTHQHSVATEGREYAYAGRVDDAEAAAGNIERQELCTCGASRWVAINGRHRVAGAWSKTASREGAPTMRQAVYAYRAGNNAGAGYAPYTDEPGDGSIEEAVAAAERVDGWTLVLGRSTSDDVAVLRNADGEWMAIGGDSAGGNAWAVDITTAVRRAVADQDDDMTETERREAHEEHVRAVEARVDADTDAGLR